MTVFAASKVCSKCRIYKAESGFPRSANRPDGLHSWCRVCLSDDGHRRGIENPELSRERYRRESTKEGYMEKRTAAEKEWRKTNPEKSRAKKAKDRASARDRLTDGWVKGCLFNRSGGYPVDVPKELIEEKRAQLHVHRALRELNKLIKQMKAAA